MHNVEKVRFGGVLFRRYPDSRHHSERSYFTPGIADRKRGVGYLHQEIWKAANGPIPDDHDIHHVDGNSLNNDVSNLQALTKSEHQRIHTEQRKRDGFYSTPSKLAHMEKIRPLTKAWHAGEEGRAWHREHAKVSIGSRQAVPYQCEHCGTEFASKKPGKVSFCSNNCRAKARYASGVDNVDRVCVICGVMFSINRYQPAVSCSRQCGRKWREQKRQLNS